MPSDCQCSTACDVRTVTKTVTKVINNKEATRRIKRLEKEVKALKDENAVLKSRAKNRLVSKKKIVSDLKKHLDRI
jgi:cell division protein FtsB